MDIKLRQVTDSIHGTIYLSSLESELISTPYFYRLHDIYQSSTVYMTFPSNRTKRYEHSLGTMELASMMFFSAISNSDKNTRKVLFEKLHGYFKEIFNIAILHSKKQVAPYFQDVRKEIDELFENISLNGNEDGESSVDGILSNIIRNYIQKAISAGEFNDPALEQFQYYPMEVTETEDSNTTENFFLYRCLLEAIRIVALFHDVGHPPYSHIIEEVLTKLYKECLNANSNSDFDETKLNNFKECIQPFTTKKEDEAYSCQTLFSKSSLIDANLHERVGLSFIQSAINIVIPEMILQTIASDKDINSKIANALYYIMVAEFVIAILVEKDIVFKSFHKIVDGIIDSDRLDYIMRDSINSGVDWGTIPYKRLINSAKLVYLSEREDEDKHVFVIAYPQKIVEDIEDLLLVRYKIFARINFHHRCMKTTGALQSAVFSLAKDYLSNKKNSECINPEIATLWKVFEEKVGDSGIRVIQWNDSWLISVLHKALVNIKAKKNSHITLRENLEEILLNQKRYYSILKRGADSRKFVEKILENAEITNDKIERLREKEAEKYYIHINDDDNANNILQSPKFNALESMKRCAKLKQIYDTGDIELLDESIPTTLFNVQQIMEDVLEKQKKENKITDYTLIVNRGRKKTGLPKHEDDLDEIYLYNKDKCIRFDEHMTLKQQIKAIEKNVPWIYLYFAPPANCKNINKVAEDTLDELAKIVGEKVKQRYEELFGNNSQALH